jgi:hypothetical protein
MSARFDSTIEGGPAFAELTDIDQQSMPALPSTLPLDVPQREQ